RQVVVVRAAPWGTFYFVEAWFMKRPKAKPSRQKRKRGGPTPDPRVALRFYVRPDTKASLLELAEIRKVPANLIGQAALDAYFQWLADGGGMHAAQEPEPILVRNQTPLALKADEFAADLVERAKRRMKP